MVTLATTTATTMYAPNQLHQMPLAELQPDPTQPRKYMDPVALEELTASVSQMGIIQPVVCRQDPATGLVYVVAGERRCAAARKAGLSAVPKRTLIEIARKKQERSMLTQFKKYRDQQSKIAAKAKEDADAAVPAQRKRTRAEAIVNQIGVMAIKIGDLEFPDFSAEDRAMIIETMTSMKDTLEAAITRAVKNKKRPM